VFAGDRSESISDVLVHGIVLNASTAGGAVITHQPKKKKKKKD